MSVLLLGGICWSWSVSKWVERVIGIIGFLIGVVLGILFLLWGLTNYLVLIGSLSFFTTMGK